MSERAVALPSSDGRATHDLLAMLTYCRPAGTKSERKFIKTYLRTLGCGVDAHGNIFRTMGRDPTVMWSSHTDTVHREGGRQRTMFDKGLIKLHPDAKRNCLGADDTVGVWLMREMIRWQVPGYYVFHRSEERGGIGSSYIAEEEPDKVRKYKACIALDRRGTNDVITHQSRGRCCSDDFANSLASVLGNGYKPSDRGIFTDSANYVELIGECTNLSVGYDGEHTASEVIDLEHAMTLREALLTFDASKLEFKRQPGEVDPADTQCSHWVGYGGKGYGGRSYGAYTGSTATTGNVFDMYDYYDADYKYNTVLGIVKDHPDAVADLLEAMGYDAAGLQEDIERMLQLPRGGGKG